MSGFEPLFSLSILPCLIPTAIGQELFQRTMTAILVRATLRLHSALNRLYGFP